MKKQTIAVVFGGCSPEYSVSLQSASAVIQHIDPNQYETLLIGISREGKWFQFKGALSQIKEDTWCQADTCIPAAISTDRDTRSLLLLGKNGVEQVRIDAVFPVLHGKNGEDGTVQGLFELAGIPLIGCGVLASALCMDKVRAHQLVQAAGVLVPRSFVVSQRNAYSAIQKQAEGLGFPLFVKPVKAGSSFGISKVLQCDALQEALSLAFLYDDEVILEECISGFEVGCAVLGNQELTIGALDEIELSEGFFDFTEKYSLQHSSIHVPARIPQEKADAIKESAKRVYQSLGCRGFARVDFFLDDTGRILFNEVNTIPGFTSHSRFPTMMQAIGLSLGQVISRAIDLAVK